MNETLKIINSRRSLRSYSEKVISDEFKDLIINSAMRSPTAGNMMLYSILEVEDQRIKEKLVKSCDNQPFIAKAPLVLLFLADYQRWMDYFKVCDIEAYQKSEKLPKRTPQEGDLQLACCDALIAAQTAVIAAESMGIGSCYIGDIMENYEFHKDLFNLPKYTFPITLLCFGYPKEKSYNKELTSRLSKEYIHFKNEYKRLNKVDFDEMYKDRELKHYNANATNFGQHMYSKKFTADFTVEMTRSVRKVIKEWSVLEDN
ncbi:MAG: nitroreductase family protein [Candidatus Marinimicrobia bacterium]|nr:nitroreductase family protein [Candidatus Neomarinimicrobiota bacterium]